ncbi:MAG TPA: marine proteobacterial sortase target protein [Usitatibacter sp.]|nr:marine proteobacterial sortase target protein [Usitatibacter sp.]
MAAGNEAGRVQSGSHAAFIVLGVRALLSGVAVALALGFAALVLAGNAQAAAVKPGEARSGELLLATGAPGEYTPAPTVETEVAITVTGMVARTRVTQSFHNPGSEFVEGVYVFPLPEKAAVDHLELRIGNRVIQGEIREKDEARRTYEKAKAEGRKAALVEQQRPNLFTNSVAHIGPNEMVRVTIEYQQSLAWEDGRYRLRFPLAVTPRYVPAHAPVEALPEEAKAREAGLGFPGTLDGASAQALLQPAYEKGGSYLVNPVDIAVAIDAGVALGPVSSSYHDARVEQPDAEHALVTLAKDQEEADHDFELTWTLAASAQPRAAMFTETLAGRDYALLMVVPPQPDAAQKAAFQRVPRETILIVDTSGSMQGTSIEQAKAALSDALDRLTERDRFNVVEFNSVTRPLWPQALPATPQNVRTARDWVAKLRADGGTEMAPALSFALDGGDTPGYLRQVVFMTDGGVSNEDELLGLIAQRLGRSRLFTVGIGSAPNGHFMTKAAQFGRGTFTYIGDVREVHEKMGALLEKIESPVLQDVEIRWADGTPVETFPERVPDLYLGEPLVVSASAASFAGTVIVAGTSGNQPWSVALTPSSSPTASGVGALWARAKIASLMDAMRRSGDAQALRSQVVQVALEHHLVSAYTSLVAVDVTPTASGPSKTMRVASALPRGSDAGAIPQTDTPATLQLLLGLLALAAAAIVAVIGHNAPRARMA